MHGISFIRVSFCIVSWPVLGLSSIVSPGQMSDNHGVCLLLAVWWNSTKMCNNYQLTIGVLPTSRAQLFSQGVVVAEWLRRWTRNPLGSPRVGSNPTDYEYWMVDEY